MSSIWYAPPLTLSAATPKGANIPPFTVPTTDVQPSHYKIPLLRSPTLSPLQLEDSLQDTDSLLTNMLSSLSTDQPRHHTHTHDAIFKKMTSQDEFVKSMSELSLDLSSQFGAMATTAQVSNTTSSPATIGTRIDLTPLKESLPVDMTFTTLPSRNNNDRATNTAIEVMKMSMMTLSMHDEEEAHDSEWEGFGSHVSEMTMRKNRVAAGRHHSRNYVYDTSSREKRVSAASAKRGNTVHSSFVPRTVCHSGMQIDESGSVGVLRDDNDSRSRRRHPYYRPPSASIYGRARSSASASSPTEYSAYQGSDGSYGIYHSDVY
ncbi:hypothetical protein BCR33DRAFT_720896 [Rhizoclosmatium globosum]|uniref:Uncharacterized protein n=1 Tax=Rhizoclosmatium globosum TaxID=329046 RepID=A0A1Y2BTW6_9FUNG|nr:hypothetical protein BCR33DRAFT_720896 [Rhizoclosmatium globosum]|eukprot:ORY38189.1 hypothetical protein BCR33DRAFT_720896 [Rhizoclosmatium globosum]